MSSELKWLDQAFPPGRCLMCDLERSRKVLSQAANAGLIWNVAELLRGDYIVPKTPKTDSEEPHPNSFDSQT